MKRALPFVVLGVVSSAASANLLLDGSFENPPTTPGVETSLPGGSTLGPWSILGVDVLDMSTTSAEPGNGMTAFEAEDGLASIDVTGSTNTGPTDGISQSFASVIGQDYHLTFWVGTAESIGPSPFYANPAIVNVSINGTSPIQYTNPYLGLHNGLVHWMQFSLDFIGVQTTTNIAFLNGTPLNTAYAGVDNVDLEVAPEPRPFVLLAACVGLVALPRLRRK